MSGFPSDPQRSTLVGLLRRRAEQHPERRVFTFLVDGEAEERHLTFAELDRLARVIGAELQRRVAAGSRALLLYPPGLDYIAGFFGCLYAGVVAVPLYPPRATQPDRAERLRAVVSDAGPAAVLCTSQVAGHAATLLDGDARGETPVLIATDALREDLAETWREPPLSADDLAFLQYTSGSTGRPKGVMLTHGNLLHNSGLIQLCFGTHESSRAVIWLPPYHDMGLIGGIIQPLYAGYTATLMSPAHFLQRPARWLQAVSRYRATTSGGPNFAYDLCVRKITEQERAALDLSSWEVAFNGAEPIRAETLERFAETFAPCGFRRRAFAPCYGLAEATLLVSGRGGGAGPSVATFRESEAQEAGAHGAYAPDEGGRPLVGCGESPPDQRLLFVEPTSMTPCAPGEVGELWVSGPSVARGYWAKPEETERAFGARTADGGGPFLRTGDLGFSHEGEVFITGRLKDLIIVRGRNLYPQDIELTVERSSPKLRPGCSAAFSVTADGEERLVVVSEVERRHRMADADELAYVIRRAVAQHHEVSPYAVALLKPGGVPKTSSGKIQRYACREAFVRGRLETLGCSIATEPAAAEEESSLDAEALLACPAPARAGLLRGYVRAQVANILRVELAGVDTARPLLSLGLDSLMTVELQFRLEESFGLHLPLSGLLNDMSVDQLTERLLAQFGDGEDAARLPQTQAQGGPQPLTYGQRALWFLHQVAPTSAAYNVVSAMRTRGALDLPALGRALRYLVERHKALRTVFISEGGEPLRLIRDETDGDVEVEDAAHWDEETLRRRMQALAEQPFNLEQGPLFRVHAFTRTPAEQIILLSFHHIISDFWSLAVLARDLGALYLAEKHGRPPRLPALPLQFDEYARWQNELCSGPEGARLWAYWQRQLAGELPALNVPGDRPRPPVQTFNGAAVSLHLGEALTSALKALSREQGATLYMTLLAAFQVLLSRHGGGSDILVGSPVSGRSRAEFADLIGYFVNPLVLRGEVEGDATFRSFLARTRQTVLAALEHQDFPFALLAERLQAARDPSRSPVFQAMFILHRTPHVAGADLSLFGLGEEGAEALLGDVPVESLALERPTAQFDLTLSAAEAAGGLRASLQYNSDIFDADTAWRMLGHLRTILEGVAADPDLRIGLLPILTEPERRQLLQTWNDTASPPGAASGACIHELFEAQAARTPEATALVCEGAELSFDDLNRRANQLAHRLRELGAGPDVPVAICVERSPALVIGLLGILKAGAAYVPLDPTYPRGRLAFMLSDSATPVLVTQSRYAALFADEAGARPLHVVRLDAAQAHDPETPEDNPPAVARADNLAYVIYTSGSTGKPKGVMLQHRSVVNFFAGMDEAIGCAAGDTLLAVTSVSFDISVLELLWTLTRGARVVLLPERPAGEAAPAPRVRKPIDFSLFYFASESAESQAARYRLVLEGARFGDRHGFSAVWTPERHFHEFGGLYPNPSVLSATLAGITERIQLRAGSVVLPLHDPVRVAEEWALVDNLSNGRVGIAFASGWHADDFVLRPDAYADRKAAMYRDIAVVQRLWRGESVTRRGGAGNELAVKTFPRPVQPRLPVWITAAGSAETFVKAGEIGAGVLTHLLGQSVEEVAEKVRAYRAALRANGHAPEAGHVTLMLHTFIGSDREAVRETVREPFTRYLRSSISLIENLIKSLGLPLELRAMSEQDMDALLRFAFDRYFETSALFGTPASCGPLVERLKEMGVDEIACLIDFGVASEEVLAHLEDLARLKSEVNTFEPAADYSLPAQARRYHPTMLQCTPSFMRMWAQTAGLFDDLASLRVLLLGGEALPVALAQQVRQNLPARAVNMYGPTETTIWSATHELGEVGNVIPIGRPILNTQLYILDRYSQPVPAGVVGELYIGGAGLARGYHGRPGLTAERFVPDPFGDVPGSRLYQTGDLARYRPDGTVEFVGRTDHQVKLHGFRIELSEIEAVMGRHPSVREAVAVVREDQPGDKRLVAYVVADNGAAPDARELQEHVRGRLPAYMVPSLVMHLPALPLTANGKIDRKRLPPPQGVRQGGGAGYVAPKTKLEQSIAAVWRQALRVEQVGIQDNFFDLGGHSLLMAQVQSQLQERLQQEVPLVTLLEHPTISSLAGHLLNKEPETPLLQQSVERAGRQLESRRRVRLPARAKD